jgi:hypothetical protein
MSVRSYANNLRSAGYIVTVYHQFPPGAEPSANETIITWEDATYRIPLNDDIGFVHGGEQYSVIVLNNFLVITRIPP